MTSPCPHRAWAPRGRKHTWGEEETGTEAQTPPPRTGDVTAPTRVGIPQNEETLAWRRAGQAWGRGGLWSDFLREPEEGPAQLSLAQVGGQGGSASRLTLKEGQGEELVLLEPSPPTWP